MVVVQADAQNEGVQIWLLLEMPTDVLYQIFQWLEPRDVLTLANNIETIHSFLESPDAISLWKSLFEANPIAKDCPAPPCPESVSYIEWADLLYAPLICQLCGSAASIPDFCILRRLCDDQCLSNPDLMTFFREGEKGDGGADPIWDMVPYTSITRWENARFVTIRRYWKGDFEIVKSKLDSFPSQQDAESYIAERKNHVDGLLKHNSLCLPWLGHLSIQAEAVRREKRAKFVSDMRVRCINYGFSTKEVDQGMNRLYRLDPDYELTDTKWQTLLPQIVAILKPIQKIRAVDDEAFRVQRRRELVSKSYAAYIKTLPASKWHYTPFEEVILQDLYVMIHDGSDHTLDDPNFNETQLYSRFSESTNSEAWRMRKQLEGDIIKSGILDDHASALKEDANIIDRAFAVFVCPNLKGKPRRLHCLIAWKGIWSTINYLNQPLRTIRFAAKGYYAVKAIADLLEVDHFSLMPSELDRLNIRLICNSCPFKTSNGCTTKEVLTWREYIEHYADEAYWNPMGHGSPNISLLSASAVSDVQQREDKDAINREKVWSCGRCAHHYRNYVPRESVLEHLHTEHDVTTPTDEDIILMNIPHAPREPVTITLEPLENLICVMCPLSNSKLYSQVNISAHLRDVHAVGEDSSFTKLFYEVQIIRASTRLPENHASSSTSILRPVRSET